MIFPQVTAEEWSATYQLDVKSGTCLNCGAEQIMDIPFAHGRFRGFIAALHDCGEEFRQCIFVPVDEKERKELGELVTRMARGEP